LLKPEFLEEVQKRIKGYVKENWGCPFIFGFIILLLSAAFFLAAGWASLAENTADFAYFALATGVVLQLIYLKKDRSKNEGVPFDGSS
jgi:hypothetical protein